MDKNSEKESLNCGFDVIVLTAANEHQANGYRKELEFRKRAGILDKKVKTLVVSDLGGMRIGSFFATVNVLNLLRSELKANAKILICHSGGDSRRTPAYAAAGKVFTPVPCKDVNGAPLALFDLILRNCSLLPINSGVLIASGDVVPTFDASDVSKMDFSSAEITGVAYFDSPQRGSRHGVYIPTELDVVSSCQRVAGFLQKPDFETARNNGAINKDGCLAVDTGLVALSSAASLKVAEIANGNFISDVEAGLCHQMDLYEEFLMAALPNLDEVTYKERFAGKTSRPKYHDLLHVVYDIVHKMSFNVNVASSCDFFHIGSSAELLSCYSGDNLLARRYGFAKGRRTDEKIHGDEVFAFNSPNVTIEAKGCAFVENVGYEGVLILDGRNIVTGLPNCAFNSIALPEGVGIVAIPMGGGKWAAVAYGIKDDFKTPFLIGAKPCLFLNRPIEEWMEARSVASTTLWNNDEKDGLWTARLWKVGSIEEVVEAAVAIAGGKVDGVKVETDISSAECYSMAQLCVQKNNF